MGRRFKGKEETVLRGSFSERSLSMFGEMWGMLEKDGQRP